ncbi:MAG TPA: lysylphosphatidylglycerol synthase transmembrane domain-containing protein [Candidatus Thermoplasmatota archaeon]
MHGTRWRFWATTVLGLAGIAFLYVTLGSDGIATTLANVDPVFLLFGFLSYAFFFIIRGIRWRLLLRDIAPDATVADTTSLSAAGWLVSTFIPMKAGDITRTALVARRTKASMVGVAGSVALERALDLIGLALFSSLSLLIFAVFLNHGLPAGVAQGVAFAWALPLAGVMTVLLVARLIKDPDPKQRWKRFIQRFARAADELRKTPKRLPILAILTALTSFAQISLFLFLIHAVAPELPMTVIAAGVPLFLLSFVVSITPANIGTYEASFVAVFTLLGLDPVALLPAGVALHILTASIVTVLGTIGFLQFRFSNPEPPTPVPAAVQVPP